MSLHSRKHNICLHLEWIDTIRVSILVVRSACSKVLFLDLSRSSLESQLHLGTQQTTILHSILRILQLLYLFFLRFLFNLSLYSLSKLQLCPLSKLYLYFLSELHLSLFFKL